MIANEIIATDHCILALTHSDAYPGFSEPYNGMQHVCCIVLILDRHLTHMPGAAVALHDVHCIIVHSSSGGLVTVEHATELKANEY
jgi:hypothetical protein